MPPADADTRLEEGIAPGDRFADGYVLCELVGEGGMGRVFRAEQTALDRSVAVKFLRPGLARDPLMLRRFHEEARAASLLSHPNLVGVIDFGVAEPGGPFLVMEYVRGWSLARILRHEGPLPLGRVVRLVGQILSALEEAHDAGVVHADIKSENVLVQSVEADAERVKIIDFGLARLRRTIDAPVEEEGLSGTPEYLAPEVIRGQVPAASADLYAVGIILYELLTGTTPFGGGSALAILERHLRDAVVPPSLRRPDRLIPPAIEQVVLCALAKDPRARFADAASFRAGLAAATGGMDLDAMGCCESCGQLRPIEVCFCPRCGASTSAAEVSSASDAPTHNWAPSQERVVFPRRALARGSRPPARRPPRAVDRKTPALYRAIARAIARGAAEDIADGYLELARALAGSGRIVSAIDELEEAIDVVSAGRGLGAGHPAPSVSRLLAALAGVHELAGDRAAARRAAIQAHWLARGMR